MCEQILYLNGSLPLLDPVEVVEDGDGPVEALDGLVVLHEHGVHVAEGVVGHHVGRVGVDGHLQHRRRVLGPEALVEHVTQADQTHGLRFLRGSVEKRSPEKRRKLNKLTLQ